MAIKITCTAAKHVTSKHNWEATVDTYRDAIIQMNRMLPQDRNAPFFDDGGEKIEITTDNGPEFFDKTPEGWRDAAELFAEEYMSADYNVFVEEIE